MSGSFGLLSASDDNITIFSYVSLRSSCYSSQHLAQKSGEAPDREVLRAAPDIYQAVVLAKFTEYLGYARPEVHKPWPILLSPVKQPQFKYFSAIAAN